MFQGDVPWDDKEFWMHLLGGLVFWVAVASYFLQDGVREVTWKEFVNEYLSNGVVRSTPGPT